MQEWRGAWERNRNLKRRVKWQMFKPKAFYWHFFLLPLNLVPKHAAVPDYLVGAGPFEHKYFFLHSCRMGLAGTKHAGCRRRMGIVWSLCHFSFSWVPKVSLWELSHNYWVQSNFLLMVSYLSKLSRNPGRHQPKPVPQAKCPMLQHCLCLVAYVHYVW